MNTAVMSLWAEGFNGIEDGRKLEGIISSQDTEDFLGTIHYGEENILTENTSLPITHIKTNDGEFRRVG